DIDERLDRLLREAYAIDDRWPEVVERAKREEGHHVIRTNHRYHRGPSSVSDVDELRMRVQGAADDALAIDAMLVTCVEVASEVERWATDPANVEADRDYLLRAREAYGAAFPKSRIVVKVPLDGVIPGLIGVVMGTGAALLALAVAYAGGSL
ncbi:MAG: hypothetical protein AAF211_23860, partial [Myxococcota bacterium]